MKKLTNNPLLFSFTIVGALLLIGIFISTLLANNRFDNQVYGARFELIRDSNEYDIAVKNKNFNILLLHLKNPRLENQEALTFQLFEGEQLAKELQFFGSNIGDPSDVRLQFAPLPDSEGVNYKVKFRVDKTDNPLYVYVSDDGKLSYKAYYKRTDKILAFSNLITSFVRRLVSDSLFVGLWGLLIIFVFVSYKRSNN